MQSNCRDGRRKKQGRRLLLAASAALALSILAEVDSPCAYAQVAATGGTGATMAGRPLQRFVVAQSKTEQVDALGSTTGRLGDGSTSSGGGQSGSMSERIRRYMQQDGGGGGGGGPGMRGQLMERLRQMPESQRREFIQRMRSQGAGGFRGQMGGGGMQGPGFGGPGGMPGMNRMGGGPGGMQGMNRMGGGPGGMQGMNRMGGGQHRSRTGVHEFRHGRGGMRGGRRWFRRKPLDFSVLNLTEQQKQKIQAMRSENSTRARAIQSQLREKRREMKSMLFSPTANRQSIIEKRDQVRALQQQAEDIMLNDFLGIRQLLTKEQLQHLPEVRPGRRHSPRAEPPSKLSEKQHKTGKKAPSPAQ